MEQEPAAPVEICRIKVRFAHPPLELNYQDERSVAERFARSARQSSATVTIERADGQGLRPLPCRALWMIDG